MQQPQLFLSPEPVRPAPTSRHPERAHHYSRLSSDGSKYKHRRGRERPMDFVQSPGVLLVTAMDLGKPLQAIYPAGKLDGTASRHHRQGSSTNTDQQGCRRRTHSRPHSTSRTRTSRLLTSGSATLTRSHSGSRGEHSAGTGSGQSRLRSSERRRTRVARPKIPTHGANGPMSAGHRAWLNPNVYGSENGN